MSFSSLERIYIYFLRLRLDDWITISKNILHNQYDLFRNRSNLDKIEESIKLVNEKYSKENKDIKIYIAHDCKQPYGVSVPNIRLEDLQNEFKLRKEDELIVFICAFNSDETFQEFLNQADAYVKYKYQSVNSHLPPARFFNKNNVAFRILKEESQQMDGKFDLSDFENIIQAIEITKCLPGFYVEIGTYKGNSARIALRYLKESGVERHAYLLDTFEGFEYKEAEESMDILWQSFKHTDTSMSQVETYLKDYPNKTLIKTNIISEDLPDEIDQIAVCNIDVDIHEAVYSALVKIAPKIAHRGIIIVEDVGHTPALGGAHLALQQFLGTEEAENFVPIYLMSGQSFLVRTNYSARHMN